MARPLRITFPGAWYHVMNRGAGRRWIFRSDAQRECFLELLAETTNRFNAEWHAYCLMPNHYHLLLRTPDGNLQRIMRHVDGVYTQYFNRRQGSDGPLFRGRYKSILVDADSYWLQLSRYIHRNPLEDGLVADLADYPWSSFRAYAGLDKSPAWLTTDYILKAVGARQRHKRYKAYMEGDTEEALLDFYEQAKVGAILGDDQFKQKAVAGKGASIDIPELRQQRVAPTLEQIIAAVCRRFNVDEEEVWTSRRGRGVQSPARSAAMYLCQQIGDQTLAQIANTFELASYASAGATIRSLRRQLAENTALARKINYIKLDLTP